MGNAASIFDCATNPLHPMPDDEAEDAGTRQLVLEHETPLRDSLIWKLQRAFYEDKGLTAWSDAIVPNFVTSNSFLARAYARIILSTLHDVFSGPPVAGGAPPSLASRNPAADYTQPVYIIELGAGHGKLGYLIVEGLLRYRAFFPATDTVFPFKYVLTDAVQRDVDAWLLHPALKEFMDLGVLDVALFDAEKDSELRLARCGHVLRPGSVRNPCVVVANYVLDSLRTDAFRVEEGALQQCCTSISLPSHVLASAAAAAARGGADKPEGAAAGGDGASASASGLSGVTVPVQLPDRAEGSDGKLDAGAAPAGSAGKPTPHARPVVQVPPSLISRLQLAWTYTPVPAAVGPAEPGAGASYRVYGVPLLDSLLSAYAASPSLRSSASVLVPVGGFAALASLLALSGGRLALLVGDKGYGRLNELEGSRDPHLAVHGSVSFMVNMHALRQIAKAYGAQALQTPYYEGFKSAVYLFGDPAEEGTTGRAPGPMHPRFPIPSAGSSTSGAGEGSGGSSSSGGFTDEEDDADLGLLGVSVTAPAYRTALASLASGAPPAPYRLTRAAVAENLTAGFTVDDFSTLQRSVKEECPDPSLKHVLALLRLANHDSDVFHKFKQTLIEKTPAAPVDTVVRDVRSDVDRLFAAYYPLQRSKDICFECGRLLMAVRDYSSAIDFFSRSNELCGEHHVTYHNMGICYFYQEDFAAALECFKASLSLRPDYAEARLWWDRATARAAASRHVGTEGGFDDEEDGEGAAAESGGYEGGASRPDVEDSGGGTSIETADAAGSGADSSGVRIAVS